MMAVPLIAGNWKMNTTVGEARELVAEMKPGLETVDGAQVVLCPPFTALAEVRRLLDGTTIGLGAQDMYHESTGAYTGEVSPLMLAELCDYVILGHSERRHLFGEKGADTGKKVPAALAAGLRPILCVGERLDERESGRAEAVVMEQLRQGLARVDSPRVMVVAYEPVWAIGTGVAATPENAQDMMATIRSTLSSLYGVEAAGGVPVLYGGSVTTENVADFIRQPDVDGALVGGASLKAESFVELVQKSADAAV